MPVARFQLPDGRVARFEVPEGTTPEQAQSMIQAQLPALTQPTPQTAAPQLPESLRPRASEAIPGPRQEPGLWERAKPFIAPTVEALGAAGGGLLGAPLGPAGVVGGAGLGYGIAKGLMKTADVATGAAAPESAGEALARGARDVLEGATFEAGGQVAGQALGKLVGKAMDLKKVPESKAAKLARSALGGDLQQAVNALRSAPEGASVADVTASIQNPAWQALVRDSLERSPRGVQYLNKLRAMSDEEAVNALSKLAGGATAAEARGTVGRMKDALNTVTGPQREAALTRANLGKVVDDFEREAGQLSEAAAGKVQEVRDLIRRGNLAEASARLDLIKRGLPVGATKYTYFGELAEKAAGEWSDAAAKASLDLGAGARVAQDAADAMRRVGIKPLEGEPLVRSLMSVTRNPEFAGNDVMAASVTNLAKDIAEWTGKGGIIDARALDAIRKNSVNAAVRDLLKGQDPSVQREAAAAVMSRLKPALIDAIENAGGTGYRQYLEDYTKGMQKIAERKLTGEAMRLWKTDKDAFVRLVQNESPDVVEKFLGKGNYNIATELADDAMSVLRAQAEKRLTQLSADKQATEGQKALTTLLRENASKFRLPSWLSFWGAAANKTLSELEKAVGTRSMKTLAEAMQSPERAANLLDTLPAAERSRVLKLISDPSQWGKGVKGAVTGTTAAGVNMLAPERYNENALAE